jgi:ankyrin repeat protein
MSPTDGKGSKSRLMTLPNELFIEVASHLDSFKDLNSLVRTSRFFHTMFNPHLYRLAVAADDAVLDVIVGWVLRRCRLASLTLLLDHGLSVNHMVHTVGIFKETMLHLLCEVDDQERSAALAQLLIQRGANMAAKVLHEAIAYDNCEIAAVFLANGADSNAANNLGYTPLYIAIGRAKNARMVNLLIAHGAAIDARNEDGDTPLLSAVREENYDVIPVLLAHGADGAAHNNYGETTLHYASTWRDSDHHELAKDLLEHGAVVNATDMMGKTPLHWLIEYHQGACLLMAKLLLENGADVNAVSNDGLSPLQLALSGECSPEVLALLFKHWCRCQLNREESRLMSRI